MKDMSNSSASSSLNQVDGGVIHVTDRSHKYNAGWYRDEFAPVRFIVRRKGMSKPPVKLGVDKSYLIEKERTS